jgi:hypothetical protein
MIPYRMAQNSAVSWPSMGANLATGFPFRTLAGRGGAVWGATRLLKFPPTVQINGRGAETKALLH